MKIDLVPLHTTIDEIQENHRRYYVEMTDGDEYGTPDVDWEYYRALSQSGSMAAVTMRDGDKLVGWAWFSFSTNPRYKNMMEAQNEGLFIEKEYRARWSDVFIKKCLEFTRTVGAHETNFTESDDKVGKWLAKHGAKSTYRIYSFSHAN